MTLEERLEAGFAAAWRPDQTDPKLLIGEIVEISQRENEYGFYPIVTIRLDDGSEVAVHGLHSVLKNELLRQKPQPGELIGVRYDGFVETPEGKFKGYEKYTVRMDRTQAEFDWAKFGVVEPDPEPALPESPPISVPVGAGTDDIPFVYSV